jgi:multiple sugar transport system permease protein
MMIDGIIKYSVRKTVFLLTVVTIIMAVMIPVVYFITVSFASNFEVYKFPAKILPTFSYKARFVYNAGDDNFSLFVKDNGKYESQKTDNDPKRFADYFMNQLNVPMTETAIIKLMDRVKIAKTVNLTLKKDIWRNYKTFLILADGSLAALFNSLQAAGWTILISLVFGGSAGYALARFNFKFKETISLSLLIVRMFPVVAISLSMVIYIMKMHLYDTPFSLALVYSVPNIALTAWITSSIFKGISPELEEAALVFGAGRLKTFFDITAPLAFPALVASSLYAFLAAWNDSITALIMTNEHPTLALVVYRTVGASNIPNIPAAGAIVLLIPSLVFTFIIKDYINQLWGNVKI